MGRIAHLSSPKVSLSAKLADLAAELEWLLRFRRLVLQRPIGRAFQILELAGPQGPEEGHKPKSAKQKRRRDEPGQSRHGFRTKASRMAFAVTRIEDVAITTAAISGVTKPAMASGTQIIL